MIKRSIVIGLFALCGPTASIHTHADADATTQPAAAPASQPARGDTLSVETIIHAPAGEIFECFKTGAGFRKAMGVADAKVDFRVGGQIRSVYRAGADLDSDQAIINTILAYEPDRMLSMKATAPAGSPEWLVKVCQAGWSVITLEPISDEITRVRVVGMGYEPGEAFDTAYKFFQKGNTATLQLMKKRLERPDAVERGKRAMQLLSQCAGATFEMTHQLENGNELRGETRWRRDVSDTSLIADGLLGSAQSLRPHATLLCGWDHEVEAPFFVQTMETGATARGYLTLNDENTVGGVWRFHGPQGEQAWYITFDFSVPGEYTTRRWKGDSPIGEPLMTLRYARRNGKQ